MAVLGHGRIKSLLRATDLSERLVVTPLLTMSQVREASIDIRLAHDFIVIRRGNLPYLDPQRSDSRQGRYQSRHLVSKGQRFFLHPGELVLAGTLEYFRLPNTISGYVTSRSRWGRAGLVIATATAVQPGYTGSITLELINHGEVPLVLYPGFSVAQLILNDCQDAIPYKGTLASHTGAEFASLKSPEEDDFWTSEH